MPCVINYSVCGDRPESTFVPLVVQVSDRPPCKPGQTVAEAAMNRFSASLKARFLTLCNWFFCFDGKESNDRPTTIGKGAAGTAALWD